MPAPSEITPEQLLRLIGTPECPALIDTCVDPDFDADPYLIPGSVRHPHTDRLGLAERLRGRRAVVICQKGKKLSQGVAAWLRSEGIETEYLSGGMFAWRDTDGAPRLPAHALPAEIDGATLWVTRHRPKIDRIACPWLIRRFIDKNARILFVAPGEVAGVAERLDATPFDTDAPPYTHAGERCTFDAMLDAFGLRTEALDRLAQVVRAADTDRHDLAPEAAGLLAISVGLSKQYRSDSAQLEAGLAIYDALYRWARDGYTESHDWPKERQG